MRVNMHAHPLQTGHGCGSAGLCVGTSVSGCL